MIPILFLFLQKFQKSRKKKLSSFYIMVQIKTSHIGEEEGAVSQICEDNKEWVSIKVKGQDHQPIGIRITTFHMKPRSIKVTIRLVLYIQYELKAIKLIVPGIVDRMININIRSSKLIPCFLGLPANDLTLQVAHFYQLMN